PVSEGGRITAAVSSQISDGAAAILVVSERALKEHNLTPRARVHHLSVRGADPIYMLTAPIPATSYALEKTGLSIDDIDLVEINEAFAPAVPSWHTAGHGSSAQSRSSMSTVDTPAMGTSRSASYKPSRLNADARGKEQRRTSFGCSARQPGTSNRGVGVSRTSTTWGATARS